MEKEEEERKEGVRGEKEGRGIGGYGEGYKKAFWRMVR